MEVTTYAILIWFTAILIASLCLVIYIGSQKLSSRAFAHSILWVAIWVTCMGFFTSVRDYQGAVFFSRLTYYIGSVIAASFIYFFVTYPEDNKPTPLLAWSLITLQGILGYLFLFTDEIIYGPFMIDAAHSWGWQFGTFSFLFELFFFGFFLTGITILYRKYKIHKEVAIKKNLKYMLWAITVGAVPPSILSIILPRFGYFDLNWLGPVTEIIWIPVIAYSIIRYQQMNVRVIITEVLAIAMAIIFFINIFIEMPLGLLGRIGASIVFIILAYYIVRISLRENTQREKLTDLNNNLEQKVAEQTREIRHAYDVEKKARNELEKLNESKNQFIMITQHHLRTPITSIIWGLEAMLNGVHGTLGAKTMTALKDTKTAANRLMHIINDFLSITALKAGTNILTISSQSLKPAIVDILQELRDDIARMHIAVDYPHDDDSWPVLEIDYNKMRDILLIVIENAVRYNHEDGWIKITTVKDDRAFEIITENSGIGITTEESEKIGSALFYRGEYARTAHPIGMGVGLSVTKAIVKAHHGNFTIESLGKGQGAKVKIVLPRLRQNL